MMGTQRGFTIIEVMLFLAISGMLFVIAFNFTSGTIRETRVRDGSDQLVGFIKQQYLAVKNVSSPRVSSVDPSICGSAITAGTSQNCTILGKLLAFSPDNKTVRVSTVVGTLPVGSETSDAAGIAAVSPKVLSNDLGDTIVDTSLELPWQGVFTTKSYRQLNGTQSNFNTLVILRSPISENILVGAQDYSGDLSKSATFNLDLVTPLSTPLASIFYKSGTIGPSVGRPTIVCADVDGAGDRRIATELAGPPGISNISGGVKPLTQQLAGNMTCL